VYLEGLVDLVRRVRVVFDTVDLHQVHANCSPERLSVHVNVPVASLRHLQCELGLGVDCVSQLGKEFVKYTIRVFLPVEVFDDMELVFFLIELRIAVEKIYFVLLESREGHLVFFLFFSKLRLNWRILYCLLDNRNLDFIVFFIF